MRDLFSMEGRLNRALYFRNVVAVYIGMSVLSFVVGMLGAIADAVYLLVGLVALVAIVSQSVRRLHDMDRDGYEYLLIIIPFYNIYFWLVLFLRKGTEGANKYGADPLASSTAAAAEV